MRVLYRIFLHQPQSTLILALNLRDILTPEEFFYHVFESLPRQGPGCPGATRKAYSYLPLPSKDLTVLDIGCGTGSQTRMDTGILKSN
ncbi:MAG TPA: hypothetical protein VMS89_00775 [Methanoregulaceae archaeon]|nr:hypothetical protein [Methanoregulaceae archaeon]